MLRYCLYISIGIMQMPDNQVICKSLSTKYALKNRHSKTAQTERCKHYPLELIAQAHRRSIGGWHSPRKLTLSKGRTPTFALRLRTPVWNALLHVRAPTTEHCRRGVKDMPQRLQDGATKAWVVVKERVQTIHVRTVRFMMFHGIVSRWGEYLLLLLFAPWPSCLFHVFNRLSWPICHARNVRCDDVIQKGASAWAHLECYSKTRSWYWNRCIITTFDPKASTIRLNRTCVIIRTCVFSSFKVIRLKSSGCRIFVFCRRGSLQCLHNWQLPTHHCRWQKGERNRM